jgi:O-antigen ligase
MKFERLVLMMLILVLPVAFWPGSTSYDASKFLVWTAAAALWIGNRGWLLWSGRVENFSRRWLLITGLGLTLLGLIGVFPADCPMMALRSTILIGFWILTVIVSRRAGVDAKARASLLAGLVVSASVVSLYGLFQIAGWLPGASAESGMPVGISTLGNQNYLAGLAAILLWPSLHLWFAPRGSVWRCAAIVCSAILAATVLFASAAGPQIALAGAGVLALSIPVLGKRKRLGRLPQLWAALLLVGLALTLVVFFRILTAPPEPGESQIPGIPLDSAFSANSGDIRRADWLIALDMFRESPLSGQGLGGYGTGWINTRAQLASTSLDSSIPGHIPPSSWAHNEYLQLLAETGLAGAAVTAILITLGIAGWARRYRQLDSDLDRREMALLSCGLVTAAIHALVSFPAHLPASALAMALLVGLVFGSPPAGPKRDRGKAARVPAVALMLLGTALLLGSVREFQGDLQIARSKALYTRGQLERAEAGFTSGLEKTLWPGEGHLYRGLARSALGRTEDAVADLSRSLMYDPTFEAIIALAELRIDQGKFIAADFLAATVLECRPYVGFRLQARFLQGLSKLRQGQYNQAVEIFSDLVNDDPANHRAHLALGYLAALAGREDLALQHYGKALKLVEKALREEERSPQGGRAVMLRQHRQAALKGLQSVQ